MRGLSAIVGDEEEVGEEGDGELSGEAGVDLDEVTFLDCGGVCVLHEGKTGIALVSRGALACAV